MSFMGLDSRGVYGQELSWGSFDGRTEMMEQDTHARSWGPVFIRTCTSTWLLQVLLNTR